MKSDQTGSSYPPLESVLEVPIEFLESKYVPEICLYSGRRTAGERAKLFVIHNGTPYVKWGITRIKADSNWQATMTIPVTRFGRILAIGLMLISVITMGIFFVGLALLVMMAVHPPTSPKVITLKQAGLLVFATLASGTIYAFVRRYVQRHEIEVKGTAMPGIVRLKFPEKRKQEAELFKMRYAEYLAASKLGVGQ